MLAAPWQRGRGPADCGALFVGGIASSAGLGELFGVGRSPHSGGALHFIVVAESQVATHQPLAEHLITSEKRAPFVQRGPIGQLAVKGVAFALRNPVKGALRIVGQKAKAQPSFSEKDIT